MTTFMTDEQFLGPDMAKKIAQSNSFQTPAPVTGTSHREMTDEE